MFAIEPNNSLLPVILLIIALAVVAGTLVSVWQSRRDAATQRAARTSALISLTVGLLALVYWAILVDEPFIPLGPVAFALLFMVPTFVIGYHSSSAWLKRSNAEEDQT